MFDWFKNFLKAEKYPYTDTNGYTYMVDKNYIELCQKAENGDDAAQYELASDYFAIGIEYVPEVVFKWTKHLAEKENDFSIMFEMGELYEKGIGCEVDYVKAQTWYNKTLELLTSKPDNFYIPANPEELTLQVNEAIKAVSDKIVQI